MKRDRVHSCLKKEKRCLTTMGLLRLLRTRMKICKSSVRAELDELIARGLVVEVARHYYALKRRVEACREYHLNELRELLKGYSESLSTTKILKLIGWSATFLNWVLEGNQKHVDVYRTTGKQVIGFPNAERQAEAQEDDGLALSVLDWLKRNFRGFWQLNLSEAGVAQQVA